MIVEADRTDCGSNADGGKRGNRVRRREQNVEAAAVVKVSKVPCRLLRVVVVRHANIFVAVMMMHDQFNVLGIMLDERSFALLAVNGMYEVTLSGSDGLPRQ